MTCMYKVRASFTFFPELGELSDHFEIPTLGTLATWFLISDRFHAHTYTEFGKCPVGIGHNPVHKYILGLDGERDMSKFGKPRIRLGRRRSTPEYHPPAVNWVGHNQARQPGWYKLKENLFSQGKRI